MGWQDIFNRIIALLLLVILSPLLAVIAIIIRIDSPGSPIFRQERVGKGGRRFNIYKFRTMYRDNDDSKYKALVREYVRGNVSLSSDEKEQVLHEVIHKRVTRFGFLLRRLSLDELPQLINIMKGDMVFIGPRPDIPFAVEIYQHHHMDRLRMKPGITGLWQVSGRRSLSFEDMVRLDIDYINRRSLFLDAKILLLTFREVLGRNTAEI
jgi:lipopolysaccharide/colanic/teichoic acid biosynthesis glycosyltransferase